MWQCPQSMLAFSLSFTDMVFHPWSNATVFRLGWVCMIYFFRSHFKAHCRRWILSPLHISGACSVTQFCLILCGPMDWSPPGSSVHGIFQARILEWAAISSSRGSSWPRNRIHISCVSCTELPGKPLFSSESPRLAANYLPIFIEFVYYAASWNNIFFCSPFPFWLYFFSTLFYYIAEFVFCCCLFF